MQTRAKVTAMAAAGWCHILIVVWKTSRGKWMLCCCSAQRGREVTPKVFIRFFGFKFRPTWKVQDQLTWDCYRPARHMKLAWTVTVLWRQHLCQQGQQNLALIRGFSVLPHQNGPALLSYFIFFIIQHHLFIKCYILWFVHVGSYSSSLYEEPWRSAGPADLHGSLFTMAAVAVTNRDIISRTVKKSVIFKDRMWSQDVLCPCLTVIPPLLWNNRHHLPGLLAQTFFFSWCFVHVFMSWSNSLTVVGHQWDSPFGWNFFFFFDIVVRPSGIIK